MLNKSSESSQYPEYRATTVGVPYLESERMKDLELTDASIEQGAQSPVVKSPDAGQAIAIGAAMLNRAGRPDQNIEQQGRPAIDFVNFISEAGEALVDGARQRELIRSGKH